MPSLRSGPPASLYIAGPFAQGYTEVYNFLTPLYGLSLGMSAGRIGMLVGARSDHWGAGQSFVILGTILIVLCVPVTLITRRAARTASNQEPTFSD